MHFFKASRGLRQGCSLSPLLYVLMAKALNKRVEQERTSGSIISLRIARGIKGIKHSKLFDDTLLIGGALKS
jgi:hypothetical protein